jgi:hypothetical protein
MKWMTYLTKARIHNTARSVCSALSVQCYNCAQHDYNFSAEREFQTEFITTTFTLHKF